MSSRSRMEDQKPAHLSLLCDDCLVICSFFWGLVCFVTTQLARQLQQLVLFLFFCVFFGHYAATQLALQLHQECTQVVFNNKVARKRLARRHSRSGPWIHECCFDVDVCVCWEWIEEWSKLYVLKTNKQTNKQTNDPCVFRAAHLHRC